MRPMNRGLQDAGRFVAQQEAAEAMSPTVSKAWKDGYSARQRGETTYSLLYPFEQHKDWMKGWSSADFVLKTADVPAGASYDFKSGQPMTQKQFETEMDAITPASERQEGGTHYRDMKIQPFEYILANGLGYAEGNVVKYISRHRAKNGIEDLKKARHYLDLLIEHETKGTKL